jgi:hypothetical protein
MITVRRSRPTGATVDKIPRMVKPESRHLAR